MQPGEIVETGITSLLQSYSVLEQLGKEGETRVQKNQFGDAALLADIKAEEVILQTFEQAHCPLHFFSEEHGELDLGEAPHLLGVLDGLDGSGVYASQRGIGRYGTMLGIFSSRDPHYRDYLFCGIMLHSPQPELFFASKGQGSFRLVHGDRQAISCSQETRLHTNARLYVDDYFAINRSVFVSNLSDFDLQCTHSSAVHYADVAQGTADAALECTRKQNLEIATAYGLITESGGVMITLEGISLGNQLYRTFSQDKHTPIITAATRELADAIIKHIH